MMMMIIMHGFDFRKQSIEAWHQQSQVTACHQNRKTDEMLARETVHLRNVPKFEITICSLYAERK